MMPGFMIFIDDLDLCGGTVSNEQMGAAVYALGEYVKTGVDPALTDPTVALCYRMMKTKVERQGEKYAAKVEAGRTGGKASGSKRKQSEAEAKQNEAEPKQNEQTKNLKPKTVNLKPKNVNLNPTPEGVGGAGGDASADAPAPTKGRFVPPTRDEAEQYAREKGLQVDVERFLAYYESNGWRVGKNPMKSWQAAMTNWSRNDFRGRDAPKAVNATRFKQRDYTEQDMRGTSLEIIREAMEAGVGT